MNDMTQNIVASHEAVLSRRDWMILPAISLITLCTLVVAMEYTARRMFPVKSAFWQCEAIFKPSRGIEAIPNSVCNSKEEENPLIEYKFNSCGHRTALVCGPKPFGSYRIVTLGTSYTMGLGVPGEDTFAAKLPRLLTELTGRKVEIYNEAMEWEFPRVVTQRFSDAVAVQPDAVLWALSPWDIKNASQLLPPNYDPKKTMSAPRKENVVLNAITDIKVAIATQSVSSALHAVWNKSRSSLMLSHFLFKSQSQYLRLYLLNGEDAGYLKSEPNDQWRSQLQHFDDYVANVSEQAKSAHIVLVVVLMPIRAQAAMVSMGTWPDGFDPYKLDEQMRTIVTSHGATYISILPDFQKLPNPEQYYYPVNNHPNVAGYEVLTKFLAKELTSGVIPALSAEQSINSTHLR